MIEFKNLLKINASDILSVNVAHNDYGAFSLEYADRRPWFYANGDMIPKTDRPAYRTLESRVDHNAILHRVEENGRIMWQFSDLHGLVRGNMPGDERGPREDLNIPKFTTIPMSEPAPLSETPMPFDPECGMLLDGTSHVVDNMVWVHAYGFIFQFPLLANRIQSRHAEFELFLMEDPKLTARGVAYLMHYINQMRHIEYISGQPQTRLDRYDMQHSVLARAFYGGAGRGR